MDHAETSSLTAQFAARCAGMTFATLPISARERTKLILLDTLGAMLMASQPSFHGTRLFAEFVRHECGDGPCSVVGTDLRTNTTLAALMNGYLGYAMDIESHHGPAVLHAAAAVVPAALAIAEQREKSGADFLAAIALGIEVGCRVSLAIGPNDLYARGFHPTAVAGSFGAAAAAGALLGLDGPGMERAFGLAATETGGLLAWASDHSEESRPFNPGLAARNGVTAAQLAALGFGAPQAIFDTRAKYNAFRAWSLDGVGTPARLLDGFGEQFMVEELIIKRHACCAFLHPALDGLLALMATDGFAARDIRGITMRFPRAGAPIIDNNELRSHCAQYILPVAAVRGAVRFEDVLTDQSGDPEIHRLRGVTSIIYDDDLDRTYPDRYATIVEIATWDAAMHSCRVDYARGTVENPMSDEEIVAKFDALAGRRFSRERCEMIRSAVENMEGAEQVRVLCATLTVS